MSMQKIIEFGVKNKRKNRSIFLKAGVLDVWIPAHRSGSKKIGPVSFFLVREGQRSLLENSRMGLNPETACQGK